MDVIIDNIELLEAAVHKLSRFLYIERPKGFGSSVMMIGRGERGYVPGSASLTDKMVDNHLHHINAVLKQLILETEKTTGQAAGKERKIEKHLVAKFNEKQPNGFKHMPD
jgi:hypothetical protein